LIWAMDANPAHVRHDNANIITNRGDNMTTKYQDNSIGWKWYASKGYDVYADVHQREYVRSLSADPSEVQSVFTDSPTGTGKTTLAVMAGVRAVEMGQYDRIIYVRNAVPVREQGYLPGSLEEKEQPYMQPLMDAMECVQAGLYERWADDRLDDPKIVTVTTSFTRGINWKNAYVIIDEAQSMDVGELQAALTRPHDCCKIVVIGSTRQNDNRKQKKYNGMTPFELFMMHFSGRDNVHFHQLKTSYRGWFAEFADKIQETIDRIEGKVVHKEE